MFIKRNFAIGLFAAAAVIAHTPAHAADAAKDPKTGKACVTFISSEWTATGLHQMNYRNTCATPFQIRIQVGEVTRKKDIEPGSPEKPSKAGLLCKSEDRCDVAKWVYE